MLYIQVLQLSALQESRFTPAMSTTAQHILVSWQALASLVDASALQLISALEAAGYEAWIVGGWVRDALLGRPAHDIDLTCSASWEETARIAERIGAKVFETGTAHGTVTVELNSTLFEVTQFRSDGNYSDGRHPDSISFASSIEEDLERRDFTINALAYHPKRGICDPFGGKEDLARGLIRAVGDPHERFSEDALRVLRALRFAVRYGFAVEEKTHQAIAAYSSKLSLVAQERIGQELSGIVASGRLYWALTHEQELMCAAIPELVALVGFDQRNYHHCYDVYEHSAHVCAAAEALSCGCASEALRWAALFHDIAKPQTFSLDETGVGHFFGHAEAGAALAEKVLHRLALPKTLIRKVSALVGMHMYPLSANSKALRKLLRHLDELCPNEAGSIAFDLLTLKRADILASAPAFRSQAHELDTIATLLSAELHHAPALRVKDLAISGNDVMDTLSIAPCKRVGEVLRQLLQAVDEGQLRNTREELMGALGKLTRE